MARGQRRASLLVRGRMSKLRTEVNDVEVLKNQVRDGLLLMNVTEREAFIQALEVEMRRAGLTIRSYLVPLGISAMRTDELTPLEAAHLVRFLKINFPQAAPAIAKVMARFGASAKEGAAADQLAA